MKLKISSDPWRVTGDGLKNPARGAHHLSLITYHSRRGIALVITLIMLAVTLVMAIAFIAVSRRERAASTTGTDTTTARLAADAAAAAAEAQIAANIFASSNAAAYDFGPLVSTNYINSAGFVSGSANPTNVNYNYYQNGTRAFNSVADFEQNVANLFYLPRVPVYMTNPITGTTDFRFYYDLNRNGMFEDTGPNIPSTNNLGVTNGFISAVGDPQWVGILERPDAPHAPDNQFIARYAFFAQPIGNGLDINGIHDETLNRSLSANDGFFRNQGVGGWEINLAAFLADLNTNVWCPDNFATSTYYQYNPLGPNNRGIAFDDARALLAYRYSYYYPFLATADTYFGSQANNVLPFDNIDTYSDGPLQTSTTNISEGLSANRDNPALPWAGATAPTNFFDLPSELFDTNKVSAGFVGRLQNAGTNFMGGTTSSTYDRYTYYRMLAQLGTDSAVDDTRLNINYDNITPAYNGVASVNGTASETNLLSWTPLGFFTNAADRMLRFYTARWLAENYYNYTNTFGSITTNAFGLTNIPVYVNGQFVYTPAVNRILQLAANIYDASTTNFFPSVFRPQFQRTGTNVFISSYTLITNVLVQTTATNTPVDISYYANPANRVTASMNIYQVPWILGAKKNLPNFNRLYTLNNVMVTRKLQMTRLNPNTPATATNEMFVLSITNHLGWSLWNSYNTNYTGQLDVTVSDNMSMQLSNSVMTYDQTTNFSTPQNFSVVNWPGSAWSSGAGLAGSGAWTGYQPSPASFVYSNWDFPALPESAYRFTTATFTNDATPTSYVPFEIGISNVPVLPQFDLRTTNYFQAFIIDDATKRVVDYVQLAGPSSYRNLNSELANTNSPIGMMWNTNVPRGVVGPTPNWGVANQVAVSQSGNLGSGLTIPQNFWITPPNIPSPLIGPTANGTQTKEASWFKSLMTDSGFYYNGVFYQNPNLVQQAPFTPSRVLYEYNLWQANDPLVHYLASDLLDSSNTNHLGLSDDPTINPIPQPQGMLNSLNDANAKATSRYQPWGQNAQLATKSGLFDQNPFNFAYRDSLVWGSDFWDFPTNKFPSVGWLGRVHRGTPWQTVFLKSTNILIASVPFGNSFQNTGTNTWGIWTGGNLNTYDLAHTAPQEDRLLFDLFTSTPNPNALRGSLSVNQPNLAAWSALLSGLVVLTNITHTLAIPSISTTPIITNLIVSPAGVVVTNSPIQQILTSITNTLATTNLFPQGVFTHVGDILRVPAFAEQSPFLNNAGNNQSYISYDLSDELYEWLPQQTLGLLRLGTPRYVVYCYGQALRPAPNGKDLSSQLVTNYQVVAESATRIVLRVDNATGTNGLPPRVVIESSTPLAPQ